MAFKARWTGGRCVVCNGNIVKGQEITWSRKGEKKLRHIACGGSSETAPSTETLVDVATGETVEVCAKCDHITCICAKSEVNHLELDLQAQANAVLGVTRDKEQDIARAELSEAIEKSNGKSNGKVKVNGKEENALLDLLADAMKTRLDGQLSAKLDEMLDLSTIETLIDKKVKEYVSPTQTLKITSSERPDIVIENAHKQLGLLVTLLGKRRHVYLHGSPGGGKSINAKLAADALGLRFGYISLDEQSPDYLVTGYMDATGVYRESAFVNFYRNGGVFCIEEMDNASGSLLTALNCALENGHLSLPNGELVERSKDFVLVACGNTAGRGAHPAFPERRPFDAAFSARFFFIKWEYDWAQAYAIAAKINVCSKPIVDWVKQASEFAEEQGIRVVLSPREAFLLADLISEETLIDEILLSGIARGLDTDSLEKITANYPFPKIRS